MVDVDYLYSDGSYLFLNVSATPINFHMYYGSTITIANATLSTPQFEVYESNLVLSHGTLSYSGSGFYSALALSGIGTVQNTGTLQASNVSPGLSAGTAGMLTTNSISLTSYTVDLGGSTPGEGTGHHDQLQVTGTVQVGGTFSASLTSGFTPTLGQEYVLIDNDGTDAISGTFTGLAQDALLVVGTSVFQVAYNGGDGNNDVVLTALTGNRHPTITSAATASITENATSVLTVTATDPDLPPQMVTYSVTGGADQTLFGISAAGELSFASPPDYENPADGNYDNVYLVEVTASDGIGGFDTQLITVTVTDISYDLKISKVGDPHPIVQAGSGVGNLKYNLTVENVGLYTAGNIEVSEILSLPAGTTIVSVTPSVGSSYFPANSATGTWSISTLNAGELATLEILLTVSETTMHGSVVSDTATITGADENLINTADDSVNLSTTVEAIDFGDAPSSYGTLLANGGAGHQATGSRLGAARDVDADGQPTALANGDDTDFDGDDEDGVVLPSTLIPRVGAMISVTASAAGFLDAWIDYNGNHVFDAAEQIATSLPVIAGGNNLAIMVPESAVVGTTYARFRLSSTGGLGPKGIAADGEVEDYRVEIVSPAAGSATIVDDPQNPGDKLLLVNGTALTDAIVVQPVPGNPTLTQVVFPGRIIGPFAAGAYDRIEIFGNAGADAIVVDYFITTPATIHGGDGNDSVVGGSGNDVIYGDGGIDTLSGGNGHDLLLGGYESDYLYGGFGNDVLIGGAGSDWLYGQDGEDITIGGTTTHDNNFAALDAIMLEWSSTNAFPNRVANLNGWLNATTVKSDGVVDYSSGGESAVTGSWTSNCRTCCWITRQSWAIGGTKPALGGHRQRCSRKPRN